MQYKRLHAKPRVVINLLSGKAFSGVVTDSKGPLLVLKSAFLHEGTQDPVQLDGEVVVEKVDVDFIQVP